MYQKTKKAVVFLLLTVICLAANAQKTVSGIVKDSNGEPMIGVSVTQEGAAGGGAITDLDGKFVIEKLPPPCCIKFHLYWL